MTAPLNADPRATLCAWIEAFNARDLNRICALYRDDAVLWGTFASDLIASRDGVREYFARAFDPVMQATAELQDVRLQSVDAAVVASGAYLLTANMAGQQRSLPARFTIVLVPARGSWVIVNHHSSLKPT